MSISKKDSKLIYDTIQSGENYGGSRVGNRHSWVAKIPTKVFNKDSVYDYISFICSDIDVDDIFAEEKDRYIYVYVKGEVK